MQEALRGAIVEAQQTRQQEIKKERGTTALIQADNQAQTYVESQKNIKLQKNAKTTRKNSITKANSYALVQKELDTSKTIETALTVGAVLSVAAQIAKGAGAITVVAAVANPFVLSAVAGAFVVGAVIVNLRAANKELLSFLSLNIEQFTDLMDFFELAELIISEMQKNEELKIFNFKSDAVKAHAELYKLELLRNSPQRVIDELMALQTESNKLKKKGFNLTGKVRRAFFSSYIQAKIIKYFNNFVLACNVMQQRFFLFINIYRRDFDKAITALEYKPQFKKVFNIGLDQKTTIAVTEEFNDTKIKELIKQYAGVAEKLNAIELKLGATKDPNQGGGQGQGQGGGVRRRTRRRR